MGGEIVNYPYIGIANDSTNILVKQWVNINFLLEIRYVERNNSRIPKRGDLEIIYLVFSVNRYKNMFGNKSGMEDVSLQ